MNKNSLALKLDSDPLAVTYWLDLSKMPAEEAKKIYAAQTSQKPLVIDGREGYIQAISLKQEFGINRIRFDFVPASHFVR